MDLLTMSNQRRNGINHQLIHLAESILPRWLDGEIRGNEYVALNPTREDRNLGSFKVDLRTGRWRDYACDDFSGGDLVSLYMRIKSFDEATALAELEQFLAEMPPSPARVTGTESAIPRSKVRSAPAPDGCHLPPDLHPDLGEPSVTYTYRITSGETAFLVYRFDSDSGKETRPVSFNPDRQDWQWRLPEPPLPIYNLDAITLNTEAEVVVVEGEKAADAATTLFPSFISTTSASGCKSALKSDWSPLHGRTVTVIPDADDAGLGYAMTIAAELIVNQADVFVVDTIALGWTNGDDVADYLDLDEDWLLENRQPIRSWSGVRKMDASIIEAAARLEPLDFDRGKENIVELLGDVSKRTVDRLVKEARQAQFVPTEEPDQADSFFPDDEPWPEPVDGKELVLEIKSIVQSHVILTDNQALAVALWILTTYVFRSFRVCPRLLVSSPEKRCGKTTLLETIQAMCFRGLAASNISAASIFRGLEAWSPTLLIDEADTFLNSNDEMRGILNSGHTKSTAHVIRVVTEGDDYVPKKFSTYAPIGIGMIKRPPDTLLDRSVVISLQRKLGADSIQPLPLEPDEAYRPVRQRCLRWAEDNRESLHGDKALTPDDIENDRARDNWTPLSAIAHCCGLLTEARDACVELTLREEDSPTVELLADIQQAFRESGKDKLPSKNLVKMLKDMEERPWSEFSRGQPLTPSKLATLLSAFGVTTRQARVGSRNLRHYFLEDLEPLFERYLADKLGVSDSDLAATSLPHAETPHDLRVSRVAEQAAQAATEREGSATVAEPETLPLPGTALEVHTGQGSREGSEVAAKSTGTRLNFSQSDDPEED